MVTSILKEQLVMAAESLASKRNTLTPGFIYQFDIYKGMKKD